MSCKPGRRRDLAQTPNGTVSSCSFLFIGRYILIAFHQCCNDLYRFSLISAQLQSHFAEQFAIRREEDDERVASLSEEAEDFLQDKINWRALEAEPTFSSNLLKLKKTLNNFHFQSTYSPYLLPSYTSNFRFEDSAWHVWKTHRPHMNASLWTRCRSPRRSKAWRNCSRTPARRDSSPPRLGVGRGKSWERLISWKWIRRW